MKEFEFNRKQYQALRKMDHNDTKEYLKAVYERGCRAGELAASSKVELPDLNGLEEKLQEIRGIGGAKARAVFDTVKAFLERKVAGEDEAGSEISGK